jgi:hypothetical protein
VRTWCLLPGRARSTGLGPPLGPVGPPGHERNRSPPATSRASSPPAASSTARRPAGPTRRPPRTSSSITVASCWGSIASMPLAVDLSALSS